MTPTHADVTDLLCAAVEFSALHVDQGGLPFVGAVLDQHGYVSAYGVNEVRRTGDHMAHAEIVAMRWALRDRASVDLSATWLLATGEPCGLCYRFAFDHGVERIYSAIDANVAAAWGFDYRSSYRAFGIGRAALEREGVIHRLEVPSAGEPFRRFDDHYPSVRTPSASSPTHDSTRKIGNP